ncbi:MAG: sigma 54-interacting transcriptional regulator, partial [Acidobacteriota bacterium]
HGVLRADLDRARRRRLPCSLLLVNPVGLDGVNEEHGRRAGDAVIREFVQAMHGLLRRSDVLMRYGGAIFALPLGNIGRDSAELVAERVRRHVSSQAFLQGAVTLRCAVGVVSSEPTDADGLEPLDLLQRANEALGLARQRQGEAIVTWHSEAGVAGPSTDRLLGIFTGRTDKDYRNMGLLWDVLQALSGATGSADLAEKVVDRLASVLHPTRTALFLSDDAGVRLLFGQQRLDDGVDARVLQASDITEGERAIVAAAVATGTVRQEATTSGDRDQLMLAVPLVTDGRTLGAVCLVGSPAVLDVDRTDVHVLTGVANQLAVALDREHLAELNRVRAEHERRRLQAELQDLRSQQSPIVFQSGVMAELLVRARRVASTDTTVLVTGESGTGKEMLAQTLHQLSGRRAKPFVIVDCGAIPATLIDSELFGHERGAFTGAQQRSIGRLAMADGGTVFLDEIGELPLDVQSRLLRFVQEKTISMVGGTRSRKVDVRIIAATNRRLEDEVRAGRFREDLFYRLNVVRLHIPPLRERPEDVRLLAEHFARASAAEQRKPLLGFSPDAERALLAHSWPGNIRELHNTILQAVVLSEGECLEASDFALPAPEADAGWALRARPLPAREAPPLAAGRRGDSGEPFDLAWQALRAQLAGEVQAAASARPRASLPLGRWLGHELVLVAHEFAAGVGARAATRTGLPQTTFARRLRQAETDRPLSSRPETWGAVRTALARVMSAADLPPGCLSDRVDALLLEVVLEAVPAPLAYAASLMGLSTPTMKMRLAARQSGATGSAIAS